MKIVTDLDGVLRELNQYINEKFGVPYPDHWNWKFEGKSIFDFVRDNPEILFYSPKSKYFDVIIETLPKPIEIWSAQPESWKILTKAWCNKNIGINQYTIEFMSGTKKYQKLLSQPNTLLIEDSPNFQEYSKIILIDMPYNQKVEAKTRIKSIKNLKILLDKNIN